MYPYVHTYTTLCTHVKGEAHVNVGPLHRAEVLKRLHEQLLHGVVVHRLPLLLARTVAAAAIPNPAPPAPVPLRRAGTPAAAATAPPVATAPAVVVAAATLVVPTAIPTTAAIVVTAPAAAAAAIIVPTAIPTAAAIVVTAAVPPECEARGGWVRGGVEVKRGGGLKSRTNCSGSEWFEAWETRGEWEEEDDDDEGGGGGCCDVANACKITARSAPVGQSNDDTPYLESRDLSS